MTVPTVTVPPVTIPKVTTPSIPTPVGTVPSVSTPPVTTPKVTTPSVSTPSGKTPSVSTPPVSPGSGKPASGSSSSGSSTGAPSTFNSGSAGSPAAQASPAQTGPSASAAGTSSGPSAVGSSSSARAGSRTLTAAGGRLGQRRRAAAQADNRRLRRLVARLHACLGSLTPQSQRLLTLRAGLGASAPLSAVAVARLMHLSRRREALLEQMSVTTLRMAANNGCGAAVVASTAEPAVAQLVPVAASLPVSATPSAAPAPGTSVAGSPRAAARARPAHSRHKAGHGAPPAGTATPRQSYERASTSDSTLPVLTIALIALLLAAPLLVWPPSRRRLLAAPALLAAASAAERRTKPGTARDRAESRRPGSNQCPGGDAGGTGARATRAPVRRRGRPHSSGRAGRRRRRRRALAPARAGGAG